METKPTIYTEDFVRAEVKKLLDILKIKTEYIFLWELIDDMPYSRQRFSEWEKDFSYDEEISDTIKKIKDILESRAATWAMKGDLNATMTIFHLKNNYKWIDKSEKDIRVSPISDIIKDLDGAWTGL